MDKNAHKSNQSGTSDFQNEASTRRPSIRRKTLPKHCRYEYDRGKLRVRFQKGAFSIQIKGIPWSDRFVHKYAMALERAKQIGRNAGTKFTFRH
jgi:hypothetical protein